MNVVGWVVLKSDVSFSDKLNIPLAKLCAITEKGTWEGLVNTDSQRRILFPSNFNDDRFKNNFPFHMLESKLKYDFSVAISYLNKNYKFSLLDYKMYCPNLITNDGYIDHHQKVYRDYEVKFPKIVIKLKKNLKNKK